MRENCERSGEPAIEIPGGRARNAAEPKAEHAGDLAKKMPSGGSDTQQMSH